MIITAGDIEQQAIEQILRCTDQLIRRTLAKGVGGCSSITAYEVELARSSDRRRACDALADRLNGLARPGTPGTAPACGTPAPPEDGSGPPRRLWPYPGPVPRPGRAGNRPPGPGPRTGCVSPPEVANAGPGSPKTVRGARLNGPTPAQCTGTVKRVSERARLDRAVHAPAPGVAVSGATNPAISVRRRSASRSGAARSGAERCAGRSGVRARAGAAGVPPDRALVGRHVGTWPERRLFIPLCHPPVTPGPHL
jgi:hypothetical protein